ncbi:MAG: phosphocholine cytidylyltransferase family protein [Candidatus Protochlamydia sp.]|nr:phosphocholine cytidylyltransferase family protein [Candidatus Protochlamydia sp.]
MKIVILAAGKGTRLDNTEGHEPKALTRLTNEKSILQTQLEAISLYASLDQVILVIGYQKEKIMAAFPELLYVYNSLYDQENTAKSLLRAVKKIDDDVLWLNGDVIFDPKILKPLLERKQTAMIVNQATVGEEEIKYRTNQEGLILEVSKQVEAAEGEALGINFCQKSDLPLFRTCLEECRDKDYFEKGIEKGIQQGMKVWSSMIGAEDCAEIDFPEDLIRTNKLLRKWS